MYVLMHEPIVSDRKLYGKYIVQSAFDIQTWMRNFNRINPILELPITFIFRMLANIVDWPMDRLVTAI